MRTLVESAVGETAPAGPDEDAHEARPSASTNGDGLRLPLMTVAREVRPWFRSTRDSSLDDLMPQPVFVGPVWVLPYAPDRCRALGVANP
jgi:hypothetical protein